MRTSGGCIFQKHYWCGRVQSRDSVRGNLLFENFRKDDAVERCTLVYRMRWVSCFPLYPGIGTIRFTLLWYTNHMSPSEACGSSYEASFAIPCKALGTFSNAVLPARQYPPAFCMIGEAGMCRQGETVTACHVTAIASDTELRHLWLPYCTVARLREMEYVVKHRP